MSEKKVVIASIIKFLQSELDNGGLPADSRESLEVGLQCLETAFDMSDSSSQQSVNLVKLVKDELDKNATAATPEQKAEAEKLKNEGNNLMKADKYKEALDLYTKAISLDSRNAVFFCNRAAAHFKMNNHELAVEDCNKALAIDPDYSKAHGRLGLALTGLERHVEARVSYARALQLEPENESYRTNLRLTEERLARGPPNPLAGFPGSPGVDFSTLLHNPALMNMATEMLSDPGMQNLISGMLGSAGGAGAAGGAAPPNPGGMNALLEAGQMLAQHMQQSNPDLVEQLRRQMNTNNGQNPQNPQNPPPAP